MSFAATHLVGFGGRTASAAAPSISYIGRSTAAPAASSFNMTSVSIGATGTQRRIVAGITAAVDSGVTLNSLTINGVSTTITVQANDSSSYVYLSALAIAAVPTGTSVTFAFTFSGNCNSISLGVFRIVDLNSNTALTSISDTSLPWTLDRNVTPEDISIAVLTSNGVTAVWSGVTEQYDAPDLGFETSGAMFTHSATESPRAMSVTSSGATEGVAVIAVWGN